MAQPEPDTKDWTWILDRRCPECGLSVGSLDPDSVADRAEAAAGEWMQILTSNPAVDRRPQPAVWSPLEYGAHVRDVYQLADARIGLMLSEDDPTFENWDQDETALTDDYAEQDPDLVAEQLMAAAVTLVGRLRSLEESQLERTGRRSDGAEFSVLTFARYILHDLLHHLWDVTGQQSAEALAGVADEPGVDDDPALNIAEEL